MIEFSLLYNYVLQHTKVEVKQICYSLRCRFNILFTHNDTDYTNR